MSVARVYIRKHPGIYVSCGRCLCLSESGCILPGGQEGARQAPASRPCAVSLKVAFGFLGRQIYREPSFVPAYISSDHNIFLVRVQFGEFSKENIIFFEDDMF